MTTMDTPQAAAAPPLECDLVMKGGITSGVVYPLAVCELATVYRLRSVGGSSAGAIAAAAAACAELNRAGGGFDELAKLPTDLTEVVQGQDSRLFTLFQPQPTMARLFRFVTAGLGKDGGERFRLMGLAALRSWLGYAVAGAVLGVLVIVLGFALGGAAAWTSLVAGLVLLLAGVVAGIVVGALADVRRIPEVGFGLCSGFTHDGDDSPALTSWLHQTFQTLAGRTVDDEPVTFGDLAAVGIKLQLMTTNLSRRQPIAMPWVTAEYSFDPDHFRTLFPANVVDRMLLNAPSSEGLVPFPAADDLPVLVGVRMSLSFPGLIAAVPLHSVDYSLKANQGTGPKARVVNWFSDGGICANLPLHFFDSALPRRPTFAIDLEAFPVDRAKSTDERDNSYLPVDNNAGLLRRQTVLSTSGLGGLVGFFGAVIDTARVWVDEAQLSMPGYRDRIVTVWNDPDEGGMNLNMPPAVVEGLSLRGQGAAGRLVDRFAGDQPGVVPAAGWDNHRWVRFRTIGAAFSDTLQSFTTGYHSAFPGSTPYPTWVGVDAEGHGADGPLPSYPLTQERRDAVNRRTQGLLDTAAEWATPPADAFTDNPPRPRPTMRLVPSDKLDDLPQG